MSARQVLPALAACVLAAAPLGARPPSADWRLVITSRDHQRLKTWRDTFTRALDQARAGGAAASIATEGALLDPDMALDGPRPPDGSYSCRMIRLGTKTGGAAWTALPPAHCRVGGDMLVTLEGSQRPGGRLYADDAMRLVLLGGLSLGDEQGMARYGRDPDRNLAGLVERIGDRRWRLLLPAPPWQGLMDVVELVPDGG